MSLKGEAKSTNEAILLKLGKLPNESFIPSLFAGGLKEHDGNDDQLPSSPISSSSIAAASRAVDDEFLVALMALPDDDTLSKKALPTELSNESLAHILLHQLEASSASSRVRLQKSVMSIASRLSRSLLAVLLYQTSRVTIAIEYANAVFQLRIASVNVDASSLPSVPSSLKHVWKQAMSVKSLIGELKGKHSIESIEEYASCVDARVSFFSVDCSCG